MKQLKRFTNAVLLFSGCLFLSCHQHSILEHKEQQRSLEIVVENFSSQASRTIAPSQITAAQLQGGTYQLRLSGTTGRMTLPEKVVTLANGRATLPSIDAGLWELTLAAYNGATKVLEGKSTVQVHAVGNTTVSFLLKPVKLATGTIDITLRWKDADRAYVQSQYPSQLTVSISLYNTQTDRMVAGTEAVWTRSATNQNAIDTALQYRGGGRADMSYDIDAGEYLLVFRIYGGILAERGTELRWSDNLYVEAGRQTTGTIEIPQLHAVPAVPTHFDATVNSNTNTYISHLVWSRVYNADHYEVEIKSFTSGNWTAHNENTWNTLSGGKVYSYKVGDYWKTTDGPVCVEGGLSKDSGFIKFYTTRSSGQFLVARMRAANAYGTSGWHYLPYLLNPAPQIKSMQSTAAKNPSGNITYRHFTLTARVSDVDYETSFQFQVFRLNDMLNDGNGNTIRVAITDVNTPLGWETYAQWNLPGNNANNGKARTIDGTGASSSGADRDCTFNLGYGNEFCYRVRAVSSRGNSCWTYYPNAVKGL